MLYIGYASVGIAAVLIAIQLVISVKLALCHICRPLPAPVENALPPATILLCVRGNDPSLAHCLHALLNLDYPNYKIRIVVDSLSDPAWEVIGPVADQAGPARLSVEVLADRRQTCTLKLSSLIQGIAGVDSESYAVVVVDADVIPYRHWLRDLVGPLLDPRIGAATGMRWYVPNGPWTWGTLVRSVWNAAACAQMYAFGIPWGGSLAFRASLFRDSDLLQQWAHSFTEDTLTPRLLQKRGQRVQFVPQATMINHEITSLGSAIRFIRRQLLCARLYHWSWPYVLALGVGLPVSLGVGVAMAAWTGDRGLLLVTAALLGILAVGVTAVLSWADRLICQRAVERGDLPYPYSWKSLPAVPITALIHPLCLISAQFLRKIDWRGVTYRLGPAGRIRLVADRPFIGEDQSSLTQSSLV